MERLKLNIMPTTKPDIPRVMEMVNNEPDALLTVTEDTLLEWIGLGQSLVGRLDSGLLIAHHALSVWPICGYVEGRSAFVDPIYRGQGFGSKMKDEIDKLASKLYPDRPMISFTESGSGIRNIVQERGFVLTPLSMVPDEIFTACPPTTCYRVTGRDCGCKVYIKQPQ